VIGSPLFDNMAIPQKDGEQFVIHASDNGPENVCIHENQLNNAEHDKTFRRHGDIVRGGRMDTDVRLHPHCKRSVTNDDQPVSVSTHRRDVPTLVIDMTHDEDVEAVRAEMNHNQQSH
jgi:putative alpha-1,2-mannosidase